MVKNSSSLTDITDLTELVGVGDIGCQSGTVFQWDLEEITGMSFTAYPSAIVLMTNLLADNVVAAYVDKATFEYYNRTEDLRIIYDWTFLYHHGPISSPTRQNYRRHT